MHDLEQSLLQEESADTKENSPPQPNFAEYTYKSISGVISNNRGLRVESEDNAHASRATLRFSVLLDRTFYLDGLCCSSTAHMRKHNAAIPETVLTICHCHHWSLSLAQFEGSVWGAHVITTLLIG